METRVSSKNVTLNEKVYQLKKIDARSACWLFSFMSAKSGDGPILSGLGNCTRKEFDDTQELLLRSIMLIDKDASGATFEIPVMGANGVLVGDLKEDPGLTYKLTVEAILFNLQPFLVVIGSSSQT